jgi:hypothetical protein
LLYLFQRKVERCQTLLFPPYCIQRGAAAKPATVSSEESQNTCARKQRQKYKAGSIERVLEMKSLARTYECDANKLAKPRDGSSKEVSFVGYYNLKPDDKVRILESPFEMKTITVSCSCSHHSSITFPEDSEVLDFWVEEYRREGCEPIITDGVIRLGAGKKMSRNCGRSSDEENSYRGR